MTLLGPAILDVVALTPIDFVDGSLITGTAALFAWLIFHTLQGKNWRQDHGEEIPERVERMEQRQDRLIRDLRGADDDSTHIGHFAETEQALARLEKDMTELRGDVNTVAEQVDRLCHTLQTHPNFEHIEQEQKTARDLHESDDD